MPNGTHRPKHTPVPPVIVATNLEDDASGAILQAHVWAAATQAQVIVCHVTSSWLGALVGEGQARKVIAERFRALTGDGAAVVKVMLPSGSPHAGVLEAAERKKPDLIVVGASTASSVERMVHGSTAEEIARYAPCSVLVARPGVVGGPVVVGTDFTAAAHHAVDEADALAKRRSVELIAAHSLFAPRSPLSAFEGLFF